MACYTISDCVLEHLDDGKIYTTELLLIFTQENGYRIAIDKKGKIQKIYTNIAEGIVDNDIKFGIIEWLYLMKAKPSKWEYIEIDEEKFNDIFLEVCSNTIDRKLIVSSENNCKWTNGISAEKIYTYNNTSIHILNKDEAIKELKQNSPIINNIITNTNTNTNK